MRFSVFVAVVVCAVMTSQVLGQHGDGGGSRGLYDQRWKRSAELSSSLGGFGGGYGGGLVGKRTKRSADSATGGSGGSPGGGGGGGGGGHWGWKRNAELGYRFIKEAENM